MYGRERSKSWSIQMSNHLASRAHISKHNRNKHTNRHRRKLQLTTRPHQTSRHLVPNSNHAHGIGWRRQDEGDWKTRETKKESNISNGECHFRVLRPCYSVARIRKRQITFTTEGAAAGAPGAAKLLCAGLRCPPVTLFKCFGIYL